MPLKGACVTDSFWSLSYRIFAMHFSIGPQKSLSTASSSVIEDRLSRDDRNTLRFQGDVLRMLVSVWEGPEPNVKETSNMYPASLSQNVRIG